MRKTSGCFIVLLSLLNGWLWVRPRLLPLVQSCLALNLTLIAWFVMVSFVPARMPPRRPVLQAIIIMLMLLFDAVTFAGTYIRLEISKHPVVTLAQPTGAFNWMGLDGKTHDARELRGRPLIVHFWGSWCMPCRKELPELIRFARRRPDIMFLTVAMHDTPANIRRAVKAAGSDADAGDPANILYASDPETTLSYDYFHAITAPTSLLIDAGGVIRLKVSGPVDWNDDAVRVIAPHQGK